MIIVAFKKNDDFVRTSGLWQWDYGQILRIQGLDLPTAVEIHFSLQRTGGDSITRVGVTKDGVTDVPIPDSVLDNEGAMQDYDVYAFVYLTNDTSGETVKCVAIKTNARPKPEAFDKPEEAELFREAISAVNAAADRAEEAAKKEVTDGRINDAVDDYLNEHGIKESDPTVPDWAKTESPDKTLTQSGQAADAKAVWDAIENTNESMKKYVDESVDSFSKGNVILNDDVANKITASDTGYNFLSGTSNSLGIKGYKILSITKSYQFESDANLYHQLDIEVDDKNLDEKAVNNYAIKDIVNIVVSYHWVNCYAISALSTNAAGNSIISVKPWSVVDNNFYDRAVDNDVIVDYDTSDTENWLYVDGKSFGTPVLRTRGATLMGEQNSSVGRYTFGAGRQNIISDDGGVALGRQNKVGYLSFAQGRSNSVMNGYAFGDMNIIEWSNSLGSFVYGMQNKIRKPSKGIFISGYNNQCVYGSYSSILGGNNEINGSSEFVSIFGSMNVAENVKNTTLIGQYLHAAYSNQAIFGMRNVDDPNAVMVVAFPEEGKENVARETLIN